MQRWPDKSVVKFRVCFGGALCNAAFQAIKSWDEVMRPLGIRVLGIRNIPLISKLRTKNRIAFHEPSVFEDSRWADAPVETQGKWITKAEVRLNKLHPWGDEGTYRIVLHELGHCLGLGHLGEQGDPEQNAMMSYNGPRRIHDLQPLDVEAVRRLYR